MGNPDDDTIRQVAVYLESLDIRFEFGNCFILDVNHVLDLHLHGADYVNARLHGVSLRVYREWKLAMANRGYQQCEATTREGRQCLNSVCSGPYLGNAPQNWVHRDRYCAVHGDGQGDA